MKSWYRGLLPALGVACLALATAPPVNPNLYLNDVKFLASPELRGRATGSPELEKAAAFIAGKFREFGLKPADGKDYYQPFQVTTSAKPGPDNRLTVTDRGKTGRLAFHRDFTPFNFSHSGHFAGGVIFAGYGITAPEYHYDDYAGLDVKGKIVLILRHEPQEADDGSVFAGKAYTQHAQFASKASNAKMHGAAAVILINDLPNHPGGEDKLQVFGSVEGPDDAGIPVVQIKEAVAERWFAEAGRPLDGVMHGIDHDLKPESFSFPPSLQLDANVDLKREVKTVHNVTAYLPGTTDEYVILGAHYDHLGLGGQYSLAPSMTGTVHPGADDNASGTAGVIELARWFATQPRQKRGILFLTFAGEELGLLGSSYWANHPELPIENAVTMLNMDMIGRVRNGKLYIGGSATGTTLRGLLDQVVSKQSDLKVDYSEGPESESSDHASFIAKHVPSLFFFSGLHSDYHKPSDTWDKINAPGASEVLQLVAEVTDELREAPARPQFVKPAPPPAHGGSDAGPVSGYGPWFGSVPDFCGDVVGVKFADVTAGSPAFKAGLRGGDVLVEFDGKPIQNLYDFTYALRAKRPGDAVRVRVMRDGKPLAVTVVLAKR
jgi:Peptidase family M28/PDZ domain/PA domain